MARLRHRCARKGVARRRDRKCDRREACHRLGHNDSPGKRSVNVPQTAYPQGTDLVNHEWLFPPADSLSIGQMVNDRASWLKRTQGFVRGRRALARASRANLKPLKRTVGSTFFPSAST